jgi:hypothetical protein
MKALVSIFLVGFFFIPASLAFSQPAVNDFQIVSFRGEWQYNTLYIIGEIKNVGRYPGGPQIEVIARDQNGVLVDSVKFWPNSTTNLRPGSSCGIKHSITKNRAAKTIEIKVVSVDVW